MTSTAFAGPLSRWYHQIDGDLERLRLGVEAWRDDLRSSVAQKVGAQLEWDEGAAIDARFDLGDSGWLALRLFAFYAERTEFEMPDSVPALLELDRDWRLAHDAGFARSLYGQLLACRIWLPGDFPVTFAVPLPDGATAEVGSLTVLADQLKWLNQRTFAADAAEIARWRELPAPAGGELLDAARRGYAGLLAAVTTAQNGPVPVVVREV